MKKNEKTASIPIIMMSAAPGMEDSARMCGAEDYLSKPFEIKNLLKTIEKVLS